MKTSLSKNGYKIKKKELDPKEIKEIKDELNVKPFTFPRNQKIDNSNTKLVQILVLEQQTRTL